MARMLQLDDKEARRIHQRLHEVAEKDDERLKAVAENLASKPPAYM